MWIKQNWRENGGGGGGGGGGDVSGEKVRTESLVRIRTRCRRRPTGRHLRGGLGARLVQGGRSLGCQGPSAAHPHLPRICVYA
jgi:hypothetical protein